MQRLFALFDRLTASAPLPLCSCDPVRGYVCTDCSLFADTVASTSTHQRAHRTAA
jgi:hypothetical protein